MRRSLIGIGLSVLAAIATFGKSSELNELTSVRYRASGIFHVFDATFKAPLDAANLDPLDEFPKELEFEYARRIDSEQLVNAAEKILEKSVSSNALEAVRTRIDRLNAAYRDVGRGDRYTLRYEPGKGTSLLLNGKVIHETPGEDFHRIYFSIWLGPDSPFDLRPQS